MALRVEESDAVVSYTVTVTPRRGPFAGRIDPSSILAVQFYEDDRPVGQEQLDIPPNRGGERIFTVTREPDGEVRRVRARVRLDDAVTTLTVVRR